MRRVVAGLETAAIASAAAVDELEAEYETPDSTAAKTPPGA